MRTDVNNLYNESDLLKELAGGSAGAFDRIYYRYYEAVRTNVFKILRDDMLTDDILQEVFANLWHKRERFEDYGKISGWLFVASYNQSMNFLRRQAAERLNRPPQTAPVYQETPEEENWQELQLLLLEQAINQLPSQRRRVFELCRFQGRTYDQAALELAISRNTVKDHLGKASEAIREYLLEHGGRTSSLAVFTLLYFELVK